MPGLNGVEGQPHASRVGDHEQQSTGSSVQSTASKRTFTTDAYIRSERPQLSLRNAYFLDGLQSTHKLAGGVAQIGALCTVASYVAPASATVWVWGHTVALTPAAAWIPQTAMATKFLALAFNVCNPASLAIFGVGVVGSFVYASYKAYQHYQTYGGAYESIPSSSLRGLRLTRQELAFAAFTTALLAAAVTPYLYIVAPATLLFKALTYTNLALSSVSVLSGALALCPAFKFNLNWHIRGASQIG